jgi:drug/metabolite transporter (DMT)-like permease
MTAVASTIAASSSAATRRLPDGFAFTLMILLCAISGLQQVAIKSTIAVLGPMLQAGLRSLIAALLVWGWARARGTPLFRRDGTLTAGLLVGLLFAGEFICVFFGLSLTSASRMAVFLSTAPCFTALGLHVFVPGERLRAPQWLGMTIAFAGISLAFADGFARTPTGASPVLAGVAGDALGVLASLLWAATTVVVRTTSLSHASASKPLFYQLAVSAIVLLALAAILERGHAVHATPMAMASIAYEAVIVAFASYLTWFWLLKRYVTSQLSAFSFLTPLFGVGFGVVLLGESFSARSMIASVPVLMGIVLVNATRSACGQSDLLRTRGTSQKIELVVRVGVKRFRAIADRGVVVFHSLIM